MKTDLINEAAAKRAKENYSFSDYKEGSATAEYNKSIETARKLIDKAKERVSDEGKEKLENLFNRYSYKLADWTNRNNAAGASHVSWAIAGPANYNMNKHNKYMDKQSKLFEEYESFSDIESKIRAIVAGDKIIKSNDKNAIEKLNAKLNELQKGQEMMKSANKIIKNKKLTPEERITEIVKLGFTEKAANEITVPNVVGHIGFASYSLTNNNAKISQTKKRIAQLERLAERAAETPAIEIETDSNNGVKIVDNLEAQRLQMFFPDKPSAECRTELKKNGFRWTPSAGCWQCYRNPSAGSKAKAIADKYYS